MILLVEPVHYDHIDSARIAREKWRKFNSVLEGSQDLINLSPDNCANTQIHVQNIEMIGIVLSMSEYRKLKQDQPFTRGYSFRICFVANIAQD